MAKVQKVSITRRALVARINRKLGHDLEQLKKCRVDSNGYSYLGDFYLVDLSKNNVQDTHVDIVTIAKKLKVLAEYEQLES